MKKTALFALLVMFTGWTVGAFEVEGLQAAIDAAAAAGGGVVNVPKGTWDTGPLRLKSGVTLHLEKGAKIRGNPDISVYRAQKTGALIQADGASNVAITGEGVIDGRGGMMASANWRPHLVNFFECTNVLVEGVTLRTGGSWTLYARRCDGVTYRGVKIWSHVNHCEDGMDVASRNVLIENCDVDADDDALVFKTPQPDMVVENVEVRNCRFASSCNAIKFGTESHGRFRNVNIHDCVLAPPSAMGRFDWRRRTPSLDEFLTGISAIAIETVDGADLSDITIRDIRLSGYQVPFFVRFGNRHECRTGRKPMLRNVLVENVEGSARSQVSSSITGVEGRRVENVVFRNIKLALPGGGTAAELAAAVPEVEKRYPEALMFGQILPAGAFYVRHADGVRLENIEVEFEKKEQRPAVFTDDAKVEIVNCRFANPLGEALVERVDAAESAALVAAAKKAQMKPFGRWVPAATGAGGAKPGVLVLLDQVKDEAVDDIARFCRGRSMAMLCPSVRDVPGVLSAIDAVANEVDGARILLRGEGRGADLALALLAAAPERFAGAVAVGPAKVPSKLANARGTPARIIAGFADAAGAAAAIEAYNQLAPEEGAVEKAVAAAAGGTVPGDFAFKGVDEDFPVKVRPLVYRKRAGAAVIELTKGKRVSIFQPTLEWLAAQGARRQAGAAARRLVLAGDSTLQYRKDKDPAGSWGEEMRKYLAEDVELVNCARGGRSTRTYMDEWCTNALPRIRPGDWVIIQFGHNDMSKASDPKIDRQTDPDTEYMNNLHRYIADARLKGAYPLLVTSIAIYPYDTKTGEWRERNQLAPWVTAMQRVAREFKVPIVDLNALTLQKLRTMGAEAAKGWYMLSVNGKDGAHPVKAGAGEIARLFVEALRKESGNAVTLLKK